MLALRTQTCIDLFLSKGTTFSSLWEQQSSQPFPEWPSMGSRPVSEENNYNFTQNLMSPPFQNLFLVLSVLF